jgi:hypothetical protein
VWRFNAKQSKNKEHLILDWTPFNVHNHCEDEKAASGNNSTNSSSNIFMKPCNGAIFVTTSSAIDYLPNWQSWRQVSKGQQRP